MNKKTTNIIGIIIIIVGIIVSGITIVEMVMDSKSDYGMLTGGTLTILIGILILGTANRNRKS